MNPHTDILETPMISTERSGSPNFPPCRLEGFTVSLVARGLSGAGPVSLPAAGKVAPLWELRVAGEGSGENAEAGSCVLAFSQAGGEAPSPRQVPHPVLGEWFSALRYTGCLWMEAGTFSVRPGFSEEAVLKALWEGLQRLMQRNGVTFLVGAAPSASLSLDHALRQGARLLEPTGAVRYFLFAI
jgi:hypothetical protein